MTNTPDVIVSTSGIVREPQQDIITMRIITETGHIVLEIPAPGVLSLQEGREYRTRDLLEAAISLIQQSARSLSASQMRFVPAR